MFLLIKALLFHIPEKATVGNAKHARFSYTRACIYTGNTRTQRERPSAFMSFAVLIAVQAAFLAYVKVLHSLQKHTVNPEDWPDKHLVTHYMNSDTLSSQEQIYFSEICLKDFTSIVF